MTCEKSTTINANAGTTGSLVSPVGRRSAPFANAVIGIQTEAVRLIRKGKSVKYALIRDEETGHQVFYETVEMDADGISELINEINF